MLPHQKLKIKRRKPLSDKRNLNALILREDLILETNLKPKESIPCKEEPLNSKSFQGSGCRYQATCDEGAPGGKKLWKPRNHVKLFKWLVTVKTELKPPSRCFGTKPLRRRRFFNLISTRCAFQQAHDLFVIMFLLDHAER